MRRLLPMLLVLIMAIGVCAIPVGAADVAPRVKLIDISGPEGSYGDSFAKTHKFFYDDDGRISKVMTVFHDEALPDYIPVIECTYDSKGNIKTVARYEMTYGDEVVEYRYTYKYNWSKQLTKKVEKQYVEFDGDGKWRFLREIVTEYVYDDADRLIQKMVTEEGVSESVISYTYDGEQRSGRSITTNLADASEQPKSQAWISIPNLKPILLNVYDNLGVLIAVEGVEQWVSVSLNDSECNVDKYGRLTYVEDMEDGTVVKITYGV